MLSQSCRIVGF